MSMITLEDTLVIENTLLEDARKALSLAREEIEVLRDAVARAELSDAVKTVPDIKKIDNLYTACVETENRIAKAKQHNAGIAQNGIAFDLAAARASIGGKLARLRAAQGAG